MVLPGPPGGRVRRRRLLAERPQDETVLGPFVFVSGADDLGEPCQCLLESADGRIDVAQLVESEETDAEGLEVLGLVAL